MKSKKLLDELEQKLAEREVLILFINELSDAFFSTTKLFQSGEYHIIVNTRLSKALKELAELTD